MNESFTLPKEFAEKWIVALRSGQYKQCTQALKKRNKYCCLGVAASVLGVSGNLLLKQNNSLLSSFDDKGIDIEIPGSLKRKDLNFHLAKMNDGGSSFNEIADWLETNVEFI